MTTVADIPFHGFHMSTLVKLSLLDKRMLYFTAAEIGTRNRPGEISSFIKALSTEDEKKAIIGEKLTINDKWLLLGYLTSRCNIAFPSFEPLNFISTEIRERLGVRRTLMKEWSVPDMSKICHFSQMAPTCKELYEQITQEWQCAYGLDYWQPFEDESVSYGWAAGGVYFNVLNYYHSTCQRTQVCEIGTNKEAPSFFLFDQDIAVLDSILLYLLS